MRLIIAGDRKYIDKQRLYDEVDKFLLSLADQVFDFQLEIVEGGAEGGDRLGREYAKEFEFSYITFEADWNQGKKAGPMRNESMARYTSMAPDHISACIVFDGGGPGSANMIKTAKEFGLILRVIKV